MRYNARQIKTSLPHIINYFFAFSNYTQPPVIAPSTIVIHCYHACPKNCYHHGIMYLRHTITHTKPGCLSGFEFPRLCSTLQLNILAHWLVDAPAILLLIKSSVRQSNDCRKICSVWLTKWPPNVVQQSKQVASRWQHWPNGPSYFFGGSMFVNRGSVKDMGGVSVASAALSYLLWMFHSTMISVSGKWLPIRIAKGIL